MSEPPVSQPVPPAGWYGDPAHPQRERWWDGNTWTDKVRIASTETHAPRGTSMTATQRAAASQTGAYPQPVHGGFRPVARPATTHVPPAAVVGVVGLASFGRRLLATVIDSLLVSFVITAAMSVVIHDFQDRVLKGVQAYYDGFGGGQPTVPDDLSHLLMLMTYAVIAATVLYGTVSLGTWSRTLGQRIAGIAVSPVDKLSEKVGWSRGLARSLAWTLLSQGGGLFLVVNVISISMALWHPKRQTLPDLLARTQVVRRS
ncbi:MAG: RDD family protein [Actinobacteria bacterium]|nr:RDD family protein [Actinomycetota bacterium]